jgi:hypothetical protein
LALLTGVLRSSVGLSRPLLGLHTCICGTRTRDIGMALKRSTNSGGSVWNNFFGSDCGSSECLTEYRVTAPFYTSIAYSFGLLLGYVCVIHAVVPPQTE